MKTLHYFKVYTNNYGSPGKFVQTIELFGLDNNTVRVRANHGKISNVPASRFYVSKSTENLHYVPQRNHTGYILEEYVPN